MFLVSVDFEALGAAGCQVGDGLPGQIDFYLHLRIGKDGVEQLGEEGFAHDDGQDKVVQLVVFVDIGEETGNNDAETVVGYGPGGVFPARTGAEVLARHQNLAAIRGVVQHERFDFVALFVIAPVAEEVFAEALFGRGLEEAGGDYLVCVHILQGEGDAGAGQYVEFSFHFV